MSRCPPVCASDAERSRCGGDASVESATEPSAPRRQSLGLVSLVVRDYDEALAFYVGKLGFMLVEDTPVPEQGKRWVVVRPRGEGGAGLLLARASTPGQGEVVGQQAGGRVFLFLYTDDFWRDYADYQCRGVDFIRPPQAQPYGLVAVFRDLYGNAWDLIEASAQNACRP